MHLRRENPPVLQTGAIVYSATSGTLIIIPKALLISNCAIITHRMCQVASCSLGGLNLL